MKKIHPKFLNYCKTQQKDIYIALEAGKPTIYSHFWAYRFLHNFTKVREIFAYQKQCSAKFSLL